jgi:peptidylprolyl isomerase
VSLTLQGVSTKKMSRRRRYLLITLMGAALALSACGSSGSPSSSATTSTANGHTAASIGGIAPIPAAQRSPTGQAGTAPPVVVPSTAPPTLLEATDLIVGKGAAAAAGDTLTVQYILATYSTHDVVQSSWHSQPFKFALGEGQVIPGWDKGLVGMRVGGRRELIIPPSLGYGDQSPGPGIAANDTLVFVIDLLKVS